MRLVVTGGAGFIGSNFVRYMLRAPRRRRDRQPRQAHLRRQPREPARRRGRPALHVRAGRHLRRRRRGDGCCAGVDAVVNFAAETHVDRSIIGAAGLHPHRHHRHAYPAGGRAQRGIARYLQISTDEVYGRIGEGAFTEESTARTRPAPTRPARPARTCSCAPTHHTYGTPVAHHAQLQQLRALPVPGEDRSRCSSPTPSTSRPLPLYGDGLNVRDWLYVEDNCAGIDLVLRKGTPGEVYNIGGGNEAHQSRCSPRGSSSCWASRRPDPLRRRPPRARPSLRDRLHQGEVPGLGAAYRVQGRARLTVDWYRDNPQWWRTIKSGEWREYYARQYATLD